MEYLDSYPGQCNTSKSIMLYMVKLFQVDDEPNLDLGNGWKSPNFHPLKNLLGVRVPATNFLRLFVEMSINPWYK